MFILTSNAHMIIDHHKMQVTENKRIDFDLNWSGLIDATIKTSVQIKLINCYKL